MYTFLWIGLVFLIIYSLRKRFMDSGEITFAPGEGVVRIHTQFHPKKVEIEFCGCAHVPGCSQLEDTAEVESIDCEGFTIRYKVQSGIRILKWWASA